MPTLTDRISVNLTAVALGLSVIEGLANVAR